MTEWHPGTVFRASLLLASGLLPTLLPAATTVNVRVTVVEAASCTINNNQPIEVEFGNVIISKLESFGSTTSNYRQTLNYTLSCPNYASSAMRFQIAGAQAEGTVQSNLLTTSMPGLGIVLRNEPGAVSLNTWHDFTYPTLPVLSAIPVKNPLGGTLTGGEFTASATLKLEYQ